MPALSVVLLDTTPGTKSPSITIAALGGSWKTSSTDFVNSVCVALTLPARFDVSLSTSAIVLSADLTDGSVHAILWLVSWSYLSGPASRR